MSLFAKSFESELTAEFKERSEHTKQNEYFARYVDSFLDEVKDHLNSNLTLRDGREVSRKDDLAYKIRKGVAARADHITAPFFTYYMTNFGKDKNNMAMKDFKENENYRAAAIRLGYHQLCRPLAEPPTKTEKNEAGEEVTTTEDAAPMHWVFEHTDFRYKLAQLFGDNFTIAKKFRPCENSEENFGDNQNIRTWECTLFLEFHPKGITDADWLAKMPEGMKKPAAPTPQPAKSEWKTVPQKKYAGKVRK